MPDYFVSYFWKRGGEVGFGNSIITGFRPIVNRNAIDEITRIIMDEGESAKEFESVTILNWKRLSG